MKHSLYFLIPFVLSLAATPLVKMIAIRNGFIAYPRSDRWHKNPTAIYGGISIYLSSIISAFMLGIINKGTSGLFIGATFLFIVGLIDDKSHFKPYTKLFLQIIAGCIVIFSGITINIFNNALLNILLTLFWVVGVTNAFNLLDNIDGLSAGIAVISALMLFFSTLLFPNDLSGAFALILAGAALGFLPYNFNPAKIFMGDSGSMFLGFSLAVAAIAGTERHISNLLITMLIPVFILSVPIFDTIFVIIVRTLQGKKIFEGGKDHTSHRLVTLGLSAKKTVVLLYFISIGFGLIALLSYSLNIFTISVLGFLAFVILLFFGIFLFKGTTYIGELKTGFKYYRNHNNVTILNNIILYKQRILEVLLDLALIGIAYYAAYFLRFEGSEVLNSNAYLIKESLVWIILIKMSIFFAFGFYRGMQKYISIADLITIFKVVSISSVASILFLTFTFRFRDYSRTVFFLDWLILLFLVSGIRILFRVLSEFFSRIRETGKNILIFGAGDMGEMVIREIKRNAALNYNPIGFIDDDPAKLGNKIHGVTVLGPREKIRDIIQKEGIKEVIIAVPSFDMENFTDIARICDECGIRYRKIKGILDD